MSVYRNAGQPHLTSPALWTLSLLKARLPLERLSSSLLTRLCAHGIDGGASVASQTAHDALEREGIRLDAVTFCENAYEVAEDADALVIVTEWNEFKSLNMLQIRSAMHRPILIDGRNIYEAAEMNRLGFIYRGMGRGTGPAPSVLPPGDSTSVPQIAYSQGVHGK